MKDHVKGKYLLRISSEISKICKNLKLYHGGDKKIMAIRDNLLKIDANLYNYSLRLIDGLNRAEKS